MTPPAWTHTAYAQRLHFGAGAVARLPEILREVGARRVLLVGSADRLASDDGRRVAERLGRALAATFDGVRAHLPTSVVQAALVQARRDGIDGVVSLGGGAAMDLGKALAFFTEQEAGTPGTTYVDRPVLPHVAVPTTYAGAEVTPWFAMTDERTRTKGVAGGPTSVPLAAVYDPQLTLDTPARVSAASAFSALAHGVEAAYAIQRSAEAEALALAGVARVHQAVPAVVDEPGDLEARTELLAGSALAARSLLNATPGAHHGLAQLLGGRAGIAQGLADALLLPAVLWFNEVVVPEQVAEVAAALGTDDAGAALVALRERVGLPPRLRDVGVTEEDLAAVARLSQGSPAVQANPRPVDEDDALAILSSVW